MTIFCQTSATIDYMEETKMVEFPQWVLAVTIYYFVAVAMILAILRLNEPIVVA